MIYVKRNEAGAVVAVSSEPDGGAAGAWLPAKGDEPELLAFGQRLGGKEGLSVLNASDMGLVRVLEDLIDMLIDQSVVRFTDFPPAAQQKLLERRTTREKLSRPSLLGDDSDGLL